MPTTIKEAAAARAAGTRSASDRPRQRSAFADARDQHVRTRSPLSFVRELGDGDRSGWPQFQGYASTTEDPYEMYDFWGPYTEVVSRGAFAKTLGSNPDVPLVLQHDSMRRIASTSNGTLQLSEDDTGLLSLADLDPDDPDVQYVLPKLRSGLLREMSFRFMITAGQWSPDYTEYSIDEVDIDRGDVSIVGFGANPGTSGSLRARDLESILDAGTVDELRTAERMIRQRLRDVGQRPVMTLDDLRH